MLEVWLIGRVAIESDDGLVVGDARLERRLARLATAAPFAGTASRDFFSARVGCQLYQPVYGIDLAALCRR